MIVLVKKTFCLQLLAASGTLLADETMRRLKTEEPRTWAQSFGLFVLALGGTIVTEVANAWLQESSPTAATWTAFPESSPTAATWTAFP